MTIKVVLIDESPIFRSGLTKNLTDADIEIVGEATNGTQGQRLIRQKQPDIVLLDLYLPDTTGIQVCDFIQRHFSQIKIILVINQTDLPSISRLINTSAKGVLTKNSCYSVVEAVKSVYDGKHYLQPNIAWELMQFQQKNQQDPIRSLTDKEYQILTLLARGKTYDQIAEIRHISLKTVFNLKSSSLKKLGIQRIEELKELFFQTSSLS